MKRLFIVPVFILGLAVSFPSSAQAAIEGIEVKQGSPPVVTTSPVEDSPVTVRLLGTGNCDGFKLKWGDGTADYQYPFSLNLPFPIPTTHTYQNPGPKTIELTAKGCQVNARARQLTITVAMAPRRPPTDRPPTDRPAGSLSQLCKYIDCFQPSVLAPPKIDKFFLFSNFTPGGTVIALGSGFGSQGTGFFIEGTASSHKLTQKTLEILEWKNNYIAAKIPSNITGVTDQAAKLYVIRPDYVKSNELSVQFRAKRDYLVLSNSDVNASCEETATFNGCNPWTQYSFGAYHQEHLLIEVSHTGTDSFSTITLKNGWLFNSMSVDGVGPHQGAWVNPPQGFVPFSSKLDLNIKWHVDGDSPFSGNIATYGGRLHIEGPAGIPYK